MIEDTVVAPGAPWARVISRGQTLRIVDLEGQQAVDFLCYNAARPEERYNAADTMKIAGSIFLTTGVTLYSGLGGKLFTVTEDTCGYHDTIGGCCSAESNYVRYGVRNTPNCRDNFLRALEPFGLGLKDIVANVNWFMYVPVEGDGRMAIVDGRSRPGDAVTLRADMDALAVISNCPQVHNPANAYKPTPIRVQVLD
jgi:urea carboxylase-associated protein 1